jgi:hypothetical protein
LSEGVHGHGIVDTGANVTEQTLEEEEQEDTCPSTLHTHPTLLESEKKTPPVLLEPEAFDHPIQTEPGVVFEASEEADELDGEQADDVQEVFSLRHKGPEPRDLTHCRDGVLRVHTVRVILGEDGRRTNFKI